VPAFTREGFDAPVTRSVSEDSLFVFLPSAFYSLPNRVARQVSRPETRVGAPRESGIRQLYKMTRGKVRGVREKEGEVAGQRGAWIDGEIS